MNLVKKSVIKKLDLVIGGPPCPTFSTIGHAKIRSVETKKDKNFELCMIK